MRLWVKAVWDAVALLQYADEQLPLLLQGTLMQKHGMLIKRQVRLRLTPDMHSLEYADFDAEAGGFGARKCIALDALREVLDGGGATLGLDVAGDRVHKFDAGNGAAEKSQWLDALRGCLTNAKFHPLLQRRNMASETRVGGGVGQACADAVAMGGGVAAEAAWQEPVRRPLLVIVSGVVLGLHRQGAQAVLRRRCRARARVRAHSQRGAVSMTFAKSISHASRPEAFGRPEGAYPICDNEEK